MKISSFHVGLHLTLNNIAHRIERIYETGECVLERISDHAMVTRKKSELLSYFEQGKLQFDGAVLKNDRAVKRNEIDLLSLNEEQQKKIIRKKEYVLGAQRMLGDVPTSINLSQAIQCIGEILDDKNLPSNSSVIRWWKIWINSENNILCFLDKKPGMGKRGNFKGLVGEIINEVIEKYYLTEQRSSVQNVYNTLCFRIEELNKVRLHKLKTPNRSTFYRIINKLDKYECMAARQGKHTATTHFRAVGAGVATKYILERVEVDHTPLDVMVINRNTGLADGRPWLTVLLDKHSRMPLGIEIGFEPPSELAVMSALRNSINPKSFIAKKYPNISKDWPAYGIPTTLICDNGREFHAKNLQRMCAELNIEIQFCPKKQPNYKGAVERFLGTLNKAVSHRLPGTTFSNITQRNKYQSEVMARVTLAELKSLIYEWLVDIYCHETNRMTGKPPYELWQDGLLRRQPLMPESIDQLNLILAKEMTRKLNHEGVTIFGLAYNSSELGVLRARSDNPYNVQVRFDPSNMSSVWVYDEINGNYIVVPSIHPEYADDLSLLEHKSIKAIDRKSGDSKDEALSLLVRKEKFSEQLEKFSKSKKIRPRQKAERHNLHKKDKKIEKQKIIELKKQETISFSGFDLNKLPKFKVNQREDF